MRLKEALKGKLTKAELRRLRGFDIIGDIAVIEIHRSLVKRQKLIAQTLLKILPWIRVVAKKKGGHVGTYRRQPLQVIAGERRKTTCHREHGLEFALNAETCYFSPRLSTERWRIAQQVKPGENVLVMFSGVAPYVLVVAKHTPAYRVYGIEANPAAHTYAVENVQRNKLGHKVILIKGDAKKAIPKGLQFDRIVMPWPQSADKFLDVALKHAKKGATIHFYDFQPEGQFAAAADIVKKACTKARKKCTILRVVECGQVGVRQYRVCVDFRVL
jgi:tRNA (guanine37-N1)-methyltransferase